MIRRSFSSVTASIAITAGLLFLMQFLVATGEEIIVDTRKRHDLKLVRHKIKEEIRTKTVIPQRPRKPEVPPAVELPETATAGSVGVDLPPPLPPHSGGGTTMNAISYGDGPLVNIFKVYPAYPATAAARGLEGSVLVRYDVTTTGAVANVVVLESTSQIFNKAAIAAAYRFKYKPRTVDGIPYETVGLRNLFRFEMEE